MFDDDRDGEVSSNKMNNDGSGYKEGLDWVGRDRQCEKRQI